jgi:hypothetical protein
VAQKILHAFFVQFASHSCPFAVPDRSRILDPKAGGEYGAGSVCDAHAPETRLARCPYLGTRPREEPATLSAPTGTRLALMPQRLQSGRGETH